MVRRTLRTGGVWLTAFMTLVATTPRLECRCPDGQVKPFCIQSALGSDSSCCDEACCGGETPSPSNTDADEEACSCCQAQKPATPTDCQAEGKGCDRSVVAPAEVVATKVKPVEIKLECTSFAAMPAARDGWLPQGDPLFLKWGPQLLPPPTDRVVLLERFLI